MTDFEALAEMVEVMTLRGVVFAHARAGWAARLPARVAAVRHQGACD